MRLSSPAWRESLTRTWRKTPMLTKDQSYRAGIKTQIWQCLWKRSMRSSRKIHPFPRARQLKKFRARSRLRNLRINNATLERPLSSKNPFWPNLRRRWCRWTSNRLRNLLKTQRKLISSTIHSQKSKNLILRSKDWWRMCLTKPTRTCTNAARYLRC